MVPNNHTTPDGTSDSEESTVDGPSGNGVTIGRLYGMKSIPDMSDLAACPDDPFFFQKVALRYAERDLCIFPLNEDDEHRFQVPWRDISTTDSGQIKKWWPTGSTRGIGLDCGKSGLLVIDIDDAENLRHQGDWFVDAIAESAPPFQQTRANSNLRLLNQRGEHRYPERQRGHCVFQQPDGASLGNGRGALEPKSPDEKWGDVRGDGGLIVLFPTPHLKGGEYQWANTGAIPRLPDKIERKLRSSKSKKSGSSGDKAVYTGSIMEGGRNETLFCMACEMRRRGFSDEAIRQGIKAENLERCVPPLSDDEIESTIMKTVVEYERGEVINVLAYHDFLNGGVNVERNAIEDIDGDDEDEDPDIRKKIDEIKVLMRNDRQARRELDAEERAAIQSIDIISGDSILQMEDLRWLVTTEEGRGVLATTGVFELTGQRQQFKTAIILDLLLSVVNKVDHWLTWPINTSTDGELPHVVLAIGEGGAGIRRRIEAWLTAHEGLGSAGRSI